MSVIITNGTGTNITDANAFYAVESYNLSGFGNANTLAGTGTLLSSTGVVIPLIFTSTSAIFKGCVLSFFSYVSTSSQVPTDDRTITITLQENVSGTWTSRAMQSLTWLDIHKITRTDFPANKNYIKSNGYYTVNFDNFSSAITIDNTSNKWRLSVTVATGSGYIYATIGSQITTSLMYAAYTDVLATFSNGNDTPIIAHPTDMTTSTTFDGVLSIGDTANAVCGVICSNIVDTSTDNVCLLTILNPSSAMTFTIKGRLIANGHAGLRVGTETNRIPLSTPVTIDAGTPSVGTLTISIIGSYSTTSASYSYPSRGNLFLYGTEVDTQIAFLTIQSDVGTNQLTLDRNVSTVWSVGDTLAIGKQDVNGQGALNTYTIGVISGNEITLTSNITNYNRMVGGVVINLTPTRYSIIINTQSRGLRLDFGVAGTIIIKSCISYRANIHSTANVNWWVEDNDNAMLRHNISNCVNYSDNTTFSTFITTLYANKKGITITDCATFRTTTLYYIYTPYATQNKMGDVNIKDIYCVSPYTPVFFYMTSNVQGVFYVENLWMQNKYMSHMMYNYTKQGTFKNIYLWGNQISSSVSAYYGIYTLCTNCVIENLNIDKCNTGIVFGAGTSYNVKIYNSKFGQKSANNLYDFAFIPVGFCRDVVVYDTHYNSFDETDFFDFDDGSQFKCVNNGEVTNRDGARTPTGKFERCGDGLPDTTVRTSGTNKFSLKMIPLNEINEHYWKFKVPTGDISTKTMSFNCWIKIKDAGYYTGIHTNPTLQLNYDDGTLINTVATNTTDWQLLTLSFTPTTNYGEIEITIFGSSEAVTEDERSFYIDDMSVLYPPGVSINLGGLDLWADGMPIGPPIATSISATDIWSVLPSTFISGSIGEYLTDALKNIDGLTFSEIISILLSVNAGKTDINNLGGGQAIVKFRDVLDTKDRVSVDMNGSERTNINFDIT